MRQLIEGFVTTFLIVLTALILTQFIGASMQIRTARQFHANCIGEIEASDFDQSVIEICKAKANEKGYVLELEFVKNEEFYCENCNCLVEEHLAVCSNCNRSDAVVFDAERLCEVILSYEIKVALVQLKKEGVLRGFAR